MKIVVEPEKLIKLFDAALLYKSSAVLDNVPVRLTEKAAIIRDSSLQVLAVYSVFPKHYFIEYEVDGEETLVITKSLRKMLNQGFKGADVVTITRENDKIVLRARDAIYTEPVPEIDESWLDIKLEKSKEYGIFMVPDKVPDVILTISESDIKDLLSVDTYRFEFSNNKLKIIMEDVGSFTKIITPLRVIKPGSASISVDGDLTRRILANIRGEFYLAINNNAVAMFEEITRDYIKIFMIAAIISMEEGMEEGEEESEKEVI